MPRLYLTPRTQVQVGLHVQAISLGLLCALLLSLTKSPHTCSPQAQPNQEPHKMTFLVFTKAFSPHPQDPCFTQVTSELELPQSLQSTVYNEHLKD